MFYFAPGHETYPIYRRQEVRQVLRNAVHWAHQRSLVVDSCPMIPREEAGERL